MRIVNHTVYDTRVIRTLVCRAHRLISRTEGKLPTWRGLTVTLDYGRAGHRRRHAKDRVTGWASLNGLRMSLFLPRSVTRIARNAEDKAYEDPKRPGRWSRERVLLQIETRDCAWTVYHELWHNYGFRHGKFEDLPPLGSEEGKASPELNQMTHGLPEVLPVKPERPKKQRDLRLERYQKALQGLHGWSRRLLYCRNKVKKYARKVAYYKRILGMQPGEIAPGEVSQR